MITLYTKTNCAYSAMIVHLLDELKVPYEEKNILDIDNAAELLTHGGKGQVPYMIDSATGADFYESEQIAEYLETMYGEGAAEGKE